MRISSSGALPLLLPMLLASVLACAQSTTVTSPVSKTTPATTPVAPGSTPAAASLDYAAEPLVIEHLDSAYTFASDGTGFRQQSVVAHIQTDSAVRQFGVVNIPFASSSEHVEIAFVRVRRPDGTVTDTPVSQAIEMPNPVTTAAPFYSDLKQMQIPVRNLRAGDRLEWQAKIVRTKPEAPGQFWGQESFVSDAVTLAQSLELHVPKDMYVKTWSPSYPPVETISGQERVFRWTSSQLKPTVGKEADAEKERKKKQILTAQQELEEKEGKFPDVAWTSFKSWEAVGDWYRSLEADRIVPDPEVKAKVAELVKALDGKPPAAATSEEDKIRAVYNYVATQIRYIGVAFGVGRYQPHKASEVLENQYGDCKDKHTLLAAMLTELGLHPQAVLIGAGIRFNPDLPSPAAFNHLITMLTVGGQPVWLDSTAEVAPYRMLQYVIRDKPALAIPESGAPTVTRTPVSPPFPSTDTMDAIGSLDKEGVSHARLTLILRGDEELLLRSTFHQMSPAEYNELVQRLAHAMGYAGTTSNVEVSPLENTAEPLKISYDYERVKAGDWDNYRIIPQVMPIQLPLVDEKDPPVRAIQLGVPRVESSTSAMKLPEGWGAVLPEAVHSKSPYATYDETYRFDKGTVYAQRRVEVLQEKVPQAEWKAYKKWTDAVSLGQETYIQLTGMGAGTKAVSGEKAAETGKVPSAKPPGTTTLTTSSTQDVLEVPVRKSTDRPSGPAPAGSPSTTPSNSEAARLVADAYQAIQRRDFDTAKSQLDEAAKLNPEQTWLWTTYGYFELGHFQLPTAIEDFQKELTLHPDMYAAFLPLAQAQAGMNQRKEAKETLKKWAAAEPANPQPSVQLVSMLLEDDDPHTALEVAEAAIARLPAKDEERSPERRESEQTLLLLLGRSQIRANLPLKGAATLVALIQTSDDPSRMNDAAYELADIGLELPLAEATTRKALASLIEASKTWTLDENPTTLLGKSRHIADTWDTLGWVLYRQGKLDEAETYLHAAWLNRQTAEIGKHLGELAAARGHKAEALRYYDQALSTFSGYDIMGVRKSPGALQKDLIQRTDALRKAGFKTPPGDGPGRSESLVQLRTLPLGPANGSNGAAEYRLLLREGKVVKAEATGPKEVPGALAHILHAPVANLWPKDSDATLVRNGVLNCHAAVCELVLEP